MKAFEKAKEWFSSGKGNLFAKDIIDMITWVKRKKDDKKICSDIEGIFKDDMSFLISAGGDGTQIFAKQIVDGNIND